MRIIEVLEAPIRFESTGIGGMDRVILLSERNDKPVPVERGLHDDPRELCLVWGTKPEDRFPVVRDISVEDPLSLVIGDCTVTTLCMKIDSTVSSHEAPPDWDLSLLNHSITEISLCCGDAFL